MVSKKYVKLKLDTFSMDSVFFGGLFWSYEVFYHEIFLKKDELLLQHATSWPERKSGQFISKSFPSTLEISFSGGYIMYMYQHLPSKGAV